MADGYPRPDLPEDAATLAEQSFDELQTRMPRWRPAVAGPMTWLLEAHAVQTAAGMRYMQLWSAFSYAYLGAIDGRPVRDARPATASSTWTFVDEAPYLIAEGIPLTLTTPAGEVVELLVAEDYEHAGGLTTPVGAVQLVAAVAGAAPNDLSGELLIQEAAREYDGAELVGLLTGGAEGETEDEFLGALTRRRRLSTPRPVKGEEFEDFLIEEPDVGGSVVVDLYNAETETADVLGTTTAFVWGIDGEPLPALRQAALESQMRDLVEVNYDFFLRPRQYTTINVTTTGVALPGYDPATVEANLDAAIRVFLDPARWGLLVSQDVARFANRTVVSFLDFTGEIGGPNIVGLDRLTTLQIAADGDPLGTTNITLDGIAPATQPGTIDVTVLAP